jgi:hypothetical protein
MFEVKEREHVLHIVYENDEDLKDQMIQDIMNVAAVYKDPHPHEGAWNFPMALVRDYIQSHPESVLFPFSNSADFVIVYKEGEYISKNHQRQHAKFFIDYNYRLYARKVWNSLPEHKRTQYKDIMKKSSNIVDSDVKDMDKYEEESDLLIDEFQALHFAPKTNFFKVGPNYDLFYNHRTGEYIPEIKNYKKYKLLQQKQGDECDDKDEENNDNCDGDDRDKGDDKEDDNTTLVMVTLNESVNKNRFFHNNHNIQNNRAQHNHNNSGNIGNNNHSHNNNGNTRTNNNKRGNNRGGNRNNHRNGGNNNGNGNGNKVVRLADLKK